MSALPEPDFESAEYHLSTALQMLDKLMESEKEQLAAAASECEQVLELISI